MPVADSWIAGKTVIITGPTAGIGRATTLALARSGARLVLMCRSAAKADELRREIAAIAGTLVPEVILVDMASQASIRAAAAEFLSHERPLHVLVNNAGVVNVERRLTIDGIEETFAVNHLGYFLLTLLLLDRLRASAPARIVNVASDAHKLSRIRFDDLNAEHGYQWMKAYAQSKLANILFTYELAERLAGSGVTVNCLHPGAVSTGLGHNNGSWVRRVTGLLRPFFRSPDRGATTSVYLASSPDVARVSGEYFVDAKARRAARHTFDVDSRRRLWRVSEELTGVTA